MKECTTHHYACDCREAAHKQKIAELTASLEESFRDKDKLYRFWRNALHNAEMAEERFSVEMGEAQESNEELTAEIATLTAKVAELQKKVAEPLTRRNGESH